LFTIVLMDDNMFDRMLDKVKAPPTRLELDDEQATSERGSTCISYFYLQIRT
jgi:hypothetical protein